MLSKPGEGWTGARGHVTREHVRAFLPPPAPRSKALVCGPPGFMATVSGAKKSASEQGDVAGILHDLGYAAEHVFKF